MIESLLPTSKQQNEQASKSSVASEYEDIKILQQQEDTEERVFVGGSSSWTLDKQPLSSVEAQLPTTEDDEWGPVPFSPPKATTTNCVDSAFGFVRHNYIDSIRTWSSGGGSYGFHPTDKAFSAIIATTKATPSLPIAVATPLPVVVATPLPMEDDDSQLPGMVRADTEGSLSSESTSDGDDETMSDPGSSLASDDGTATTDILMDVDDDNDDSSSTPPVPQLSRGVSFNEQVRVLPIPPITAYTPEQRYKMYANRFELRENKTRNKKEYEFNNYDWRNATEENSMAICPLSGELLHPAHQHKRVS